MHFKLLILNIPKANKWPETRDVIHCFEDGLCLNKSFKPREDDEVLMFGSYGAGDLDPKALNKLIGNQCLRPLYCTLGTGSCKP